MSSYLSPLDLILAIKCVLVARLSFLSSKFLPPFVFLDWSLLSYLVIILSICCFRVFLISIMISIIKCNASITNLSSHMWQLAKRSRKECNQLLLDHIAICTRIQRWSIKMTSESHDQLVRLQGRVHFRRKIQMDMRKLVRQIWESQ